MKEKLKPYPFCNGELKYHKDDMGECWIEHKIKHKDGKKDPCVLTSTQVDYFAEHNMT